MNKKLIISIGIILLTTICLVLVSSFKKDNTESEILGVIVEKNDGMITIQDKENNLYTFILDVMELSVGDSVMLKYTGLLDKNMDVQKVEVVDYSVTPKGVKRTNTSVSDSMFSKYYKLAKEKLDSMSIDEKIGQILLVEYVKDKAIDDVKKYHFAGFVFFEDDFKDKSKDNVITMMNNLQKNSDIPLLTAVDEEGGNVVRVSSNKNLVDSKFLSPQELYKAGGLDRISTDTKNKSKVLKNLGINLNLAPVVDVSTNSSDYIYPRSLGQNTDITAQYAKTVIEASKGTSVSYVLKHFPGYGSSDDTHTGTSTNAKSYQDIVNIDIPPFEEGIKAGAEAVMVGHNIISSIDKDNPASLSKDVVDILRNNLKFTGIIITDSLNMGAVKNIDDAVIKAIIAGNDLIITKDYVSDISKIKAAIKDNTISTQDIDNMALRVIAWKYYKGMMFTTNQK